jgi:hypothetical protein
LLLRVHCQFTVEDHPNDVGINYRRHIIVYSFSCCSNITDSAASQRVAIPFCPVGWIASSSRLMCYGFARRLVYTFSLDTLYNLYKSIFIGVVPGDLIFNY